VIPISFVALALVYFVVPNSTVPVPVNKQNYLSSFKEVLVNKSAACLVGSMLITAAGIWSFYAASFWIKKFSLSCLMLV
jgi:hypothetical protein